MTPFDQTSVRAITIRRHTDRGPATTAYIARLRYADLMFYDSSDQTKK